METYLQQTLDHMNSRLIAFSVCLILTFPLFAQEVEIEEITEITTIEELEDAPIIEDFGEVQMDRSSDIRTMNGRFYLKIDSQLDGELSQAQNLRSFPIRFREMEGNLFGHYEGMSNDSEFTGTVVQSTRVFGLRLVSIRQVDQGYQAVFSGIWHEGKITGTYINVAGARGDFELKPR